MAIRKKKPRLKRDRFLIPFSIPVEAEITKVTRIPSVIRAESITEFSSGKKAKNPPERLKIPAPSAAAIPVTRANRLNISKPVSQNLFGDVPSIGLSMILRLKLFLPE